MYRVYRYILPDVDAELTRWERRAESIPDPELRKQALASIHSKRFHCQGGAVYAAAQMEYRHVLIPLIVALQTISDYLDNLCDRSTSLDPDDFRLLHQSMLDAVNPSASVQDYYAYRQEKDDGGYLEALVRTCQTCICMLPSYSAVFHEVTRLVSLYGDLQVYKHIRKELREQELLAWWERHRHGYPDLLWNEFAAATGSTLGMFTLFMIAAEEGVTADRADVIKDAYFPYVCGLHILLDYLIDQEEDRIGGDLNFCSYYKDVGETSERLSRMVSQARLHIGKLPNPRFHRMIIEGLVALYLSDPKARMQGAVRLVTRDVMKKSPLMRIFFWVNSIFIRKKQEVTLT
ncbi:tetraprenyl-beta-curcumene synthase family protein [Paenibacillus turpanensis]|uniref:tetraprenyl-beta-curcumene synthase family protein n=1 Tax=Paenibacillus turpanensis TaxID=2689078 RepID=UPI001408C8E6|nr:tetraprenyl-beta-curcumene synthase family protein [Paenibacillus turpanensis]